MLEVCLASWNLNVFVFLYLVARISFCESLNDLSGLYMNVGIFAIHQELVFNIQFH